MAIFVISQYLSRCYCWWFWLQICCCRWFGLFACCCCLFRLWSCCCCWIRSLQYTSVTIGSIPSVQTTSAGEHPVIGRWATVLEATTKSPRAGQAKVWQWSDGRSGQPVHLPVKGAIHLVLIALTTNTWAHLLHLNSGAHRSARPRIGHAWLWLWTISISPLLISKVPFLFVQFQM